MMPQATPILAIRKTHFEKLRQEAERVWPIEACGLLIGRLKGHVSETLDVKVTENVDVSPVTFRIEPTVLYEVYTNVETEGREIIGVFHSHPAPPAPSDIDIHYMKVNPILWLIMSMPGGSIKAYQWKDESIQKVEVRIIEQ